jgi:hypothetical protein
VGKRVYRVLTSSLEELTPYVNTKHRISEELLQVTKRQRKRKYIKEKEIEKVQ